MATDVPYEILVYSRAFEFEGWVGRPLTVAVTPRHNLMPTASFSLDADHDLVEALLAPGARVKIYHNGRLELTGQVKLGTGTFEMASTLTFTVQGDFNILHNWQGWQVPTAGPAGQNVAYRTITGPAETVLKTVARENALRLGTPLTVAPDQGRGAVGTYTFRMHQMFDRLFPRVDQAGIGVDVKHAGNGLVLDVYEPRIYPHVLSPEAGTVIGGSYSLAAPTVTRVVVGGQGEGVEREFRTFIDTAREAEWGMVIEALVDARDSSVGDVYAERAAEVLAEGAPKSGLSLELSETPNFKYDGENLRVGDIVPARIGGQVFTDTLREVKLSGGGGNGDLSSPVIGERTDDPTVALARQLRTLRRAENDRKAR